MAKIVTIAATTLALLASGSAFSAPPDRTDGQMLTGKAAFGGWQQDTPGLKRRLTVQDLPPAGGKAAQNFGEVAPGPAGAKPRVPQGFSVEQVVSGLAGPRVIRTAPNGDLFVADSMSNASLIAISSLLDSCDTVAMV